MTRYEILKTIHVLLAVVWVGGAVATQLYAIRAKRATEPGRMAHFSKDAEWVGTRIFLPSAVVLVLVGVWMVLDEWAFSQTWIILGIAGYAFSFLVGSLYLGPESGRIAALIEEKGPADPAVEARMERIFLVSRVEMVILLLVVADMVIKPGA